MGDEKKSNSSKHNHRVLGVSSERGEEAQLFYILDQLPVGVIVAEAPSGKIVWGNRQVEKIWGKTFKQCVDFNEFQQYYRAFHLNGTSYDPEERPLARSLFKGEVVNDEEFKFIRGDGSEGTMLVRSAPIRNKDGSISAAIVIQNDITEQKKLADETLRLSEEKFVKAFYGNTAAMALTSLQDGRIIDVNERWLELFGYSREEVTGRPTFENNTWKHPEEQAQMARDLEMHGSYSNREFEAVRKNGEVWTALVSAQVITLHGERVIVSSTLDITERKKAEAKIKGYSSNLEQLVEERTKELKDAERLAAIGHMAGMVGHDIRNPLQSIEGALYLAREELNSIPSQFVEKSGIGEMLDLIGEQSKYINKIVSDLQDYAKPLKPEFEKVEVMQLIEDALRLSSIPQNVDFSVTVEKDVPKPMADLTMMKRVLTNMITNAIQSMPNGGKLTINASKKEEDVYISVRDTGMGIPEEVRPKLFTPLVTTKSKGQGFGLAVCKRLVEAHGGKITFESEVGKGSTFIVDIPIKNERIS